MKATAMAAAILALASATPAFAQQDTRQMTQARPTYEQCYQLGLSRGFIVSVGDWRNFEQFIKECMAGKVPF